MDIKNIFRLTSDRKTLININCIQYVDIKDDNTILIKIQGKEDLIEQCLKKDKVEADNMLEKEIFKKMILWLCSEKD